MFFVLFDSYLFFYTISLYLERNSFSWNAKKVINLCNNHFQPITHAVYLCINTTPMEYLSRYCTFLSLANTMSNFKHSNYLLN